MQGAIMANRLSGWRGWPLWAKIVVGILVLWFVLFMIVLFLGAFGSTSDAKAATAAADYTCPIYVAVGDPNTGGTAMVDKCTGGEYVSSGNEGSTATVATASAAYGKCKQVTHQINGKNKTGWTMFWVKLTKFWCWNSKNQITYHPTTSFQGQVTGFGSAMQWDDAGLVDKNSYNPPGKWESFSWGIEKFKRCIPAPWGCVKVGEKNLESDIHAYGNGSYSW
jgi:hypothetical protein